MAVNILNLDSTTQMLANTAGDTYVVEEDVYLAVLGTAISGTAAVTNRKFQIDGHVIGESAGSGMFIGQDATNGGSSTIQIAASGSVSGEAYGIVSQGGALSLVNNGSLTGGTAGLSMTGAFNFVGNHGTVLSYDGAGINSQGANAIIENSGSIAAATDGVLLAGNYSKLNNAGNITSTGTATDQAAVNLEGIGSEFVNKGIVTGMGYAILGGDGAQTVYNYGLINGLVSLGDGSDVFHNENGSVSGAVILGAGADTFVSVKGSVTGSIYGGSGDDRYVIDNATIAILESSGDGNDTVISSVSYSLGQNFEYLTLDGDADIAGRGNFDDNVLTGNDGNNQLSGRGGNDTFHFSEGNDIFDGGAGSDWVIFEYSQTEASVAEGVTVNLATGKGGGGVTGSTFVSIENISGSVFNDRLVGNAAANSLSGYFGNDLLTGGGGRDVFFFGDHFGKDTLTDFSQKFDKINLDVVGVDSFDDLDGMISQKGKNVVIDFSDINSGDMIVIKNADISDFSGKDFLFG